MVCINQYIFDEDSKFFFRGYLTNFYFLSFSNQTRKGTTQLDQRYRKFRFNQIEAYRNYGKESIANQRGHRKREGRGLKMY